MVRRFDVADEFFASLKIHMNETFPVHVVVIALDDDERLSSYNFNVVFLWATSDTGVVLDRQAKQFIVGYFNAYVAEALDREEDATCPLDTPRFGATSFELCQRLDATNDDIEGCYRLRVQYQRMQLAPESGAEAVEERVDDQQFIPFVEPAEVPDYWGANPMHAMRPRPPADSSAQLASAMSRLQVAPVPVPPSPVRRQTRREQRQQRLAEVAQLATTQRKETYRALMRCVVSERHAKDQPCPVCYEDIGQGYDPADYYFCTEAHMLCPPCKKKWIVQQGKSCPECRKATAYTDVISAPSSQTG